MTFTGPAIEAATAGVTSTGTVFFGSIDQFPSDVRTIVKPSVLARSTDEGADWEVVVPGGLPTSPHGSLSSWMSVEPETDRVWYATPTAPCGATVSWSDDEGETWGTNPNIGCPAQGAAVLIEGPAPEGTPEPEGYPHVVYYCANSQDGTESVLACHRSRDGGRTFRFVGSTPDPVPAEEGCEPTNLRRTRPGEVAPDGVLYFPTWSCDHDELGLAISDDQGASWTTRHVHDVAVEDLYPPAMAIDTAGDLFFGYKGADGLPYVTVSTDRGVTWGPPLMLAPPGVDGIRRLGIVASDPGHILVSYLGSTDGGDSFNAYMTESRTAADERPTFVSAAVNDPSTPVNLASNEETFGDRTQFLRGHIAGDGTPWAAFHCFETDLCPGQRRGIAAQLHRPGATGASTDASATPDPAATSRGSLPATGRGAGGHAAAIAIGLALLAVGGRKRR